MTTPTLTYWALPTSRVIHGSKTCPSLTLHAQRRAAREEHEVPDRWLEPGYGRPSTCGRCGWSLLNAILHEQARRRELETA